MKDYREVPKLAIVIPCYNEEEVLPISKQVIAAKLSSLIEAGKVTSDSKIYFIDDGSKDRTWSIIEELSLEDTLIKGIKLSRNRGHQNALLAGLMTAEGDIVVSIDADLQDDINVIECMIEKYMNGCEVVYAARSKRELDTYFKKNTAELYYGILKKMGVNIVHNHADYRLMSRRALDSLKHYTEVNLFLRGVVPLVGYKNDIVYYERKDRAAGESKYPLSKMISFAIEGITSFSNVPLRFITLLGLTVSLFSFVLVAWVVITKIFTDDAVPGWASILSPILFLGGIQLLSLGVIGEYIGKIYMEAKRRPPFIIERIV